MSVFETNFPKKWLRIFSAFSFLTKTIIDIFSCSFYNVSCSFHFEHLVCSCALGHFCDFIAYRVNRKIYLKLNSKLEENGDRAQLQTQL